MHFGKITFTAGLKEGECKKTDEKTLGGVQVEDGGSCAGGGVEVGTTRVCHSGPGDRLDTGGGG